MEFILRIVTPALDEKVILHEVLLRALLCITDGRTVGGSG